MRTLKGAATLKIQCDTTFTEYLLCYYTAYLYFVNPSIAGLLEAPLDFMGKKINILKGRISKKRARETKVSEILSALR